MKKQLLFMAFVMLTLSINAQTVTDIEGTVYNTVNIGEQTWMAENLKTASYNDGESIANIADSAAWMNSGTGAYCWYNNDSATYAEAYGKLYNWYTVNTGNLCPAGWHVPTDDEWTTLTNFLGGESVAGGKLKETGTTHWSSPNTGATNETGFTALPGGSHYDNFYDVERYGWWWSATEVGTSAYTRAIGFADISMSRKNNPKISGRSIRCVKNTNTFITNAINSEQVILYPNPVTKMFYLKNINYENPLILIFDLQGKQVLSKQIDLNMIDISNLKKGIYILKLVDSDKAIITKFIKE